MSNPEIIAWDVSCPACGSGPWKVWAPDDGQKYWCVCGCRMTNVPHVEPVAGVVS